MKKLLFFSIALLFVLLACEKKEDVIADIIDDNPAGNTGTFVAEIDGESFSANSLTIQALYIPASDQNFNIHSIGITGIQYTDQDTLGIIMAIFSPNLSDFEPGETFTYTGNPFIKTGTGTISGTIGGDEVVAEVDDDLELDVTITAIDFDANKLSGTFNFTALDSDTGITYEVSEGVFTDILMVQ